ncbi:MAG: hypothetical protein R3F29_10665 [Planctomycetota bacterium]
MRVLQCCVASLSLSGLLAAQSVSVSLESLTGVSLSRTEGGVSLPVQMPAGPVGASGGVSTGPFTSAQASVGWNSSATTRAVRVWLAEDLLSMGGGSSAQVDAHEFLVTFTPSGVAPSVLRISRMSSVSGGTTFPGIAVDIGNTGSALPITVNTFSAAMPALGAQPLEVRVVFDAASVSNGEAFSQLAFELLPDNQLSFVPSATSCAPTVPLPLQLEPSFVQRGVEIAAPIGPLPAVLVIGWSSSPFLLPTPVSLPCLVVPSPDVLLLVSPNAELRLSIPLPLALRPATFHAQTVALSSIGLLAGDAYMIRAL